MSRLLAVSSLLAAAVVVRDSVAFVRRRLGVTRARSQASMVFHTIYLNT